MDVEDQNLLLFGVMSLSDRFLCVQGSSALISSYFGGNTTIFIHEGSELTRGDYNDYHRFSNASVEWTNDNNKSHNRIKRNNNEKTRLDTEKEFLALIKTRF